MNKIIYISDFFAEEILGGAEINDKEIIELFISKKIDVIKKKSIEVNLYFLNKNIDNVFFISNFCFLSPDSKQWLIDNAKYIIYEHDYKCTPLRNPALFKEYKIPSSEITNYFFYKNALTVFCQSEEHKKILSKNIFSDNIQSVSGNMWSIESLLHMEKLSKINKNNCYSILNSNNPLKGTEKALEYCNKNNIKYELVCDKSYFIFLEKIAKNEGFIFLPSVPETLSRISCEARMMNVKLIANQLVAATKEDWFLKKGSDLIEYMKNKREQIPNMVLDSFKKEKNKLKEISIITTFKQDNGFLDGFLKNITEQTIFDKCELIIVDAASSGDEQQKIEKYQQKYDNIKYIRLEENKKPTPCINIAIKESSGKYLTFAFLDDRKSKTCLQELYEEIKNSNDVHLIYGKIALSNVANETFNENSKDKFLESSIIEYSPENMVKCLPGPMPMWKKSVHDECGFFDEENCNYADDWDMWLRMIKNGFKFKKIDSIVGIYLLGGRSQQENIEQRKEEAKIFFKYSSIFGYNFNRYYDYFKQFEG